MPEPSTRPAINETVPCPKDADPTRPKNKFGLRLLILLLLITGLAAGSWWLLREHWSRKSVIHLADGQTLQAQESGSSWRYVGFGHVFGFGGGDFRAKLEFSSGGSDCVWKGNSIPIVLQFDGAHPVLVTFDRETNFAKTTFRYFRHESDWRELPLTLFPKNLAIQNMWIGNVAQILQKADFEDYLYRSSLQSLLRHCIVNGTQYWEMNGREADRKFLKDYEKQFLLRE